MWNRRAVLITWNQLAENIEAAGRCYLRTGAGGQADQPTAVGKDFGTLHADQRRVSTARRTTLYDHVLSLYFQLASTHQGRLGIGQDIDKTFSRLALTGVAT